MTTTIQRIFVTALPVAVLSVGGCYTQLGTVDDAYNDTGIVEESAEPEVTEEFDRDYPPASYYVTFSYYHPGVSFGVGWYDPWYYGYYPAWSYYPWYGWYCPPPVYACWPYVPYYGYPYYPPYADHNGYYPGGGYYGGGYSSPGTTRDFGNTRGLTGGTGRTRGGSPIVRTGNQSSPSASPATVSRTLPPRRGIETASSGSGSEKAPARQVAPRRLPPTRGVVVPKTTPSGRSNTGTSRGTQSRGAVSSPPGGTQSRGTVSSPPARSTPPPASTPSGGSRGGGGNQRGGGRR